MLLTPDQESALWHLGETIKTPSGKTIQYFPYYMQSVAPGEYERLTFEQLPSDAKDMLLANKGININTKESY
jgi:hypothetical protein